MSARVRWSVSAVSESATANFFTSPVRMRVTPRFQSVAQSPAGRRRYGRKSWNRLIGPATIVG